MKTTFWLCALSVFVLLGCGVDSPSGKTQEPQGVSELPYDRYFYALAKQGAFSGSVLVALPDTVFEQSYNMVGAPEGMNTSSNLRYPIGEVSHILIRAAYFQMADQGRITLNGSVKDYLSALPQNETINYRMLLDHRAGLPEVLPKGQSLSDLTYRSQPGIEEHYSQLGYEMLAAVLAERMGTTVEEAIRILVLEPASMSRTGVLDLRAAPGSFAVGYSDAGGAMAAVPLSEFPVTIIPEFYSTITDLFYLSQWMPESAFLKGELKQPGVRPGYRSYFYSNLESAETNVVLSNFGGTDLTKVVQGF
ncbi:MAG: serine hydrolase domain-containing protein [Saprospiraceae bacterium]